MKTSQLNPTPSGVLGTLAELLRLNDQLPKGENLARFILGDDYLSPEDVAKVYCWNYTDDQLAKFINTFPGTDMVMWLRSNGYMLVAGPAADSNLLQVRSFDNTIFRSKSEDWYVKDKVKFARNDVVKVGEWLMVRKEPYPGSRRKTWDEQSALLSDWEQIPNAPEMAYAVTAYFKVRGIRLLNGVLVRTTSVDADGHHVFVGRFDSDGLNVFYDYDGYRREGLGVAASRRNIDCLNT